jgi:hypothetical protein
MSAHSSIFIHLLSEMCSSMDELRWQDVLIHQLAQKMLTYPSSPIEPQQIGTVPYGTD